MSVKKLWQQYRLYLINAFIILNITAVFTSTYGYFGGNRVFKKIFFPYLVWSRIGAEWRLFAPEPRTFASKYHFEIIFADNTRKSWMRPYPPNWDFFERHLAYNWQKFDLATNNLENNEAVRRGICNFVLRMFWNSTNPPLSISLIRDYADWPTPRYGEELEYDENKLNWKRHILVTYFFKDGKLE